MANSICLENDVFFEAVKIEIAKGNNVRLRPKGQSMMPLIRGDRDKIILKQVSKNSFQRGSILLVQLRDKRYMVHRVCRINGNILTLSGDGNLRQTEQCSSEDVIAEIVAVIRNRKVIEKGSLKWNAYRYLWPSNHLLRRIFLKAGRLLKEIDEN